MKKVIYWQPPSVDKAQRLRISSLCLALSADCIGFNAPKRLNGAFWTDKNYLNAKRRCGVDGLVSFSFSRKKGNSQCLLIALATLYFFKYIFHILVFATRFVAACIFNDS